MDVSAQFLPRDFRSGEYPPRVAEFGLNEVWEGNSSAIALENELFLKKVKKMKIICLQPR